jgi:hypothetical protein
MFVYLFSQEPLIREIFHDGDKNIEAVNKMPQTGVLLAVSP